MKNTVALTIVGILLLLSTVVDSALYIVSALSDLLFNGLAFLVLWKAFGPKFGRDKPASRITQTAEDEFISPPQKKNRAFL